MNDYSRLQVIARDLTLALENKTQINIRLTNQRRDLEARKLALIPTNDKGVRTWPGSNPESRKIAEELAYAEDQICRAIQEEINRLEEGLALAEVALEAFVNERRALEWVIRAQRLEMRRLEFGLLDQNEQDAFDDDGLDDQEDDLLHDYADDQAHARTEQKYAGNGQTTYPEHPADWVHAGIAEEEDIPF